MPTQPLRILLIEDHGSTAQVLVRMLERRGYRPRHAGDATAALAAIGEEEFDLVISDLGLPGMTGWELLDKLRAVRPTIPAIALSGYAYDLDQERSATAGFHLHLKKPAVMNELDAAIQSLFPE
jgi:two-component system, chemotaxis family, CheB/CheR fusion protein